MYDRVCIFCNKRFKTSDKRKRFCNRKCWDKYYSKTHRVDIKCITCGKVFSVNISNNRRNKRFCSIKCMAKHRGEGMRGINHPNWKGGVTPLMEAIRHSSEMKNWRIKCFIRDNWNCVSCHIRGDLVVHHIKSFSNIIEENNIKTLKDSLSCAALWDTNNGVTLCEDCHKLTDNYKNPKGKNQHKNENLIK